MSEVNPYAPPKVDDAAPQKQRRAKKRGRKDIEAALEALDDYLQDPQNVVHDLKAAGGRLRMVTILLLIAGVVPIIAGTLVREGSDVAFIAGIFLGGLFLLIGAVAMVLDLTMVSRKAPSTPAATLKSYVRSFGLARYGYAWACLCPTAREQTVQAPDLSPVASGFGSFPMRNETGVKSYAQTFARPGGGQMRNVQIKTMVVAQTSEDVALVNATLKFQSWPQWANLLIGAGGAVGARLGGTSVGAVSLVGLVAALAGVIGLLLFRKRLSVTVQKTLLRGRNGVWYMFDADLLEGASRGD